MCQINGQDVYLSRGPRRCRALRRVGYVTVLDVGRRAIHEGDRGSETGNPPSLHSEHRNLTRTRLVGAALEKFNELGYHATRIEDIAGAAGASRSTFYLHFNGKIAIVHELIAIVTPEAEEIFARLDALESVSRESLHDTITEFVEFYTRHGRAMRAIEDAIAVDREVEAVYQPTISRFAEGLAKHLRRGSDEQGDNAQLRATLLIVQLERFCFMWIVRGGWSLDREQTISSITDIWWREIRA